MRIYQFTQTKWQTKSGDHPFCSCSSCPMLEGKNPSAPHHHIAGFSSIYQHYQQCATSVSTGSQGPRASSSSSKMGERKMNRRIKSTVLGSELQDFWLLPIFSSNHPNTLNNKFSSVQPLSHVQLLATPWTAAHQAFLSITNSWSLLKFMSIESVVPSNHLVLCHPLLLLSSILPATESFPISQLFTSGGQSLHIEGVNTLKT